MRFLFIGGINTLFGYGVFALFIYMGMHYALAALLGTVCGVLFNFKTTGIFVFRSHENRLIFRFVAVYLVVYALNVLGLKLGAMMDINAYIAGAVLILPTAIVAYLLQKKYVFDVRKESEKATGSS